MISGETGFESEVIHLYNKQHFGYRTTVEIGGEVIERVHGVRHSKEKTAEFIDKVIMFWSEKLGVYFPQPGELTQEQYVESYNETTHED